MTAEPKQTPGFSEGGNKLQKHEGSVERDGVV